MIHRDFPQAMYLAAICALADLKEVKSLTLRMFRKPGGWLAIINSRHLYGLSDCAACCHSAMFLHTLQATAAQLQSCVHV